MDLQSLKNIAKLISSIGLTLSLFFTIPLITGIVYKEDIALFALFLILFTAINSAIYLGVRPHRIKMSIKEGILSVNLIWILLGIAGGFGLYIGSQITYAEAFFESVSGFTTTGATIYSDIESLPHWVLMLRSLTHWLGGMGIIVFGVGLLTLINPTGSLTLFKSESTGVTLEKLTPKIKDTAKNLWKIYLLLTVADALLLYVGGMGPFDALNHAFSTISTGGFSTKNSSLGHWGENGFILWVTTLFMFLSAINFIAHLKALKGDFRGYLSEEVRWFAAITFILSILLSLIHLLHSDDTLFYSATHSFFTIVSVITTTGFASTDYSLWAAPALAVIFIPMFIGGNAGSTAGGVKVIRYIVLFKTLMAQIKQTLHPNALVGIYIDKSRVTSKVITSVSGFFFLFFLTTMALGLYLFANGYDFLTSFSASIASIGNIGPGFGKVGPADNFAFFTDTQKIVLALFMIVGRLEFYTFAIIFTKEFWKRF